MPEAAHLGDPIGHSPTMGWLLNGLLIGAGVALVGVAVIGTGGLAAAAIVGGAAATGAGIGEVMSSMSFAPKEVAGQIVSGSPNVFIRGRPAARAHVDFADCDKHASHPKAIATGSGNVYINGMPAARIGDRTVCSALITAGAGNVFIGGGTQQTDPIEPENLVPPIVHAVLFGAGMGAALVLGGPVIAIGGLVGGVVGGMGGSLLGGKLFGEGSDGQKWSMLGGSLVGGYFGAKRAPGALDFLKRVEGAPSTLGMGGGSIRLRPSTSTEGPYSPRAVRNSLENKYGAANVKSTTVPPMSMPNVKLGGEAKTIQLADGSTTRVVYDKRGYPIFDDVAKYDTRLPIDKFEAANYQEQMRMATRDLNEQIINGRIPRADFTEAQLENIESGAAKIRGHTWHHHQETGRMQLIPQHIHNQARHVGWESMSEGQ